MTGVLTRKWYSDTDTNRGRVVWRHRKKMAIYRPRNQSCCHLDPGLQASVTVGNSFLKFKPPNLWYFGRAALANLLLWVWESSHFLEFDREVYFLCMYLPIWECLLTWLLRAWTYPCWVNKLSPWWRTWPNYSTQVLTFISHSCIFSSIQRFMDFCCHWCWWLLYQRTSSPVLGEWLS